MDSSDDSGLHDVRKLRGYDKVLRHVSGPLIWSVVAFVASVSVNWGTTSQRITEIERRLDKEEAKDQQTSTTVAVHETDIAVGRAQYAEIIRRLDAIDKKLEEQAQSHKP